MFEAAKASRPALNDELNLAPTNDLADSSCPERGGFEPSAELRREFFTHAKQQFVIFPPAKDQVKGTQLKPRGKLGKSPRDRNSVRKNFYPHLARLRDPM